MRSITSYWPCPRFLSLICEIHALNQCYFALPVLEFHFPYMFASLVSKSLSPDILQLIISMELESFVLYANNHFYHIVLSFLFHLFNEASNQY